MARILILEDQKEMAKAWQAALTKSGHRVSLASTYEEFEAAFQSGERIELMIIDLSLSGNRDDPKFSGLVALSDNLLRTTLRGERVPCIVVSGFFTQEGANDPLRERVMPFNPDRILAKPFQLADLMTAVDELTGTKRPS